MASKKRSAKHIVPVENEKEPVQEVHIEYPVYLAIHGHFYQPPRENPWSEQIETQPSSAPYHDWNERINDECYRPNSISRVLDKEGRIDHIINNFKYLSFNIGPTLISWIQTRDPHTYERILDADRFSMSSNNGHGNAIAQVYNHIIMPLANKNDKITQIRWGIADFKRHFKRNPEGMWLAETAINRDTIECLISEGIKFTILSPTQAQRVRDFGGQWEDISNSSIDPKQPYRIFSRNTAGKKSSRKYLDVFFYDGPISQSVAFEHVLTSAGRFAEKLAMAVNNDRSRPQVVNISTDGESYGHHEKFGDMCLAYFFLKESARKGFTPINYARYLKLYPPQREVELKNEAGEGTAWSCAHGVGRWYRDCGCSTGAGENWNQKWREPLRNAFDRLRDAMIAVFEQEAGTLLTDCWKARNDYISVITDRSERNVNKFLKKHQKKVLTHEEQVKVLKMLEGQRQALLMYTSCAWFFADISGIETVQVVQYAARAIQLYQDFSCVNLENVFVSELSKAMSNLGDGYHGMDVFEKWIKPNVITPEKIVNQFGINYLILQKFPPKELCMQTISVIEKDYRPSYQIGDDSYDILFMHLKTTDKITREVKNFFSYSVRLEFDNFRSYIRVITEEEDFSSCKESLIELITNSSNPVASDIKKKCQNRDYLTLSDIYVEESQELIQNLLENRLSKVNEFFKNIFNDNIDLIGTASSLGISLPPQLKFPIEQAIEMLVVADIEKNQDNYEMASLSRVFELWSFKKEFHLEINTDKIRKILSRSLNRLMLSLELEYSDDTVQRIRKLFELTQRLSITLDMTTSQNIMFEMLSGPVQESIKNLSRSNPNRETLKQIQNIIMLAEFLNFNTLSYRNELNSLTGNIYDSPAYWP